MKNIPPSISSYLANIPVNPSSMEMRLLTPAEINHCIANLKKNGGLDDISKRFMIMCHEYLPNILSNMFNLCVNQQVFPEILKEAIITPVFKKGARNVVNNYRPISILSNISKNFESLLYSRIQSFFLSNDLLSSNQFGYRKDLGTEHAILKLISKVMPAIAEKKYCIMVFLDYSKCFDTLCRDTLLRKSDRYGIRGTAFGVI